MQILSLGPLLRRKKRRTLLNSRPKAFSTSARSCFHVIHKIHWISRPEPAVAPRGPQVSMEQGSLAL
jgi:hypothetical protein